VRGYGQTVTTSVHWSTIYKYKTKMKKKNTQHEAITNSKHNQLTFSFSLMDPFPRMDIFVPVLAWSLLKVLPLGPSNFPTKLNCKRALIVLLLPVSKRQKLTTPVLTTSS